MMTNVQFKLHSSFSFSNRLLCFHLSARLAVTERRSSLDPQFLIDILFVRSIQSILEQKQNFFSECYAMLSLMYSFYVLKKK